MQEVMSNLMEMLDAEVKFAVAGVISENDWSLADYLEALDKGDSEFKVKDTIVHFTSHHTVVVKVPIQVTNNYSWSFRTPINNSIEVDAAGTFESMLS